MDLFNEIYRLPYFFYVIGDDFKLLGGQQTKPDKPMSFNIIYDLWKKMMETYQKEDLSIDEKIYLAKSMKRMMNWCEGKNIKKQELEAYINSLSETQKKELEIQIDMYKDARKFYGLYVYNK